MRSSGKTIGLGMIAAGAILGIAGELGSFPGSMRTSSSNREPSLVSSCCSEWSSSRWLAAESSSCARAHRKNSKCPKSTNNAVLLDIVSTRGQVSIADLVLELKSSRDDVEKNLNELVGRGLFSGYVDWNKGMLYSVEASKLQGAQYCPNCGGKLELAGKGVVTCPYCGAQIFLS